MTLSMSVFCSKTFRSLYLSNPYIYLTSYPYNRLYSGPTRVRKLVDRYFFENVDDNEDYQNRYCRRKICFPFINFLDNYLSQRDDNVIHSIHLEFDNVDSNCRVEDLDSFLQKAAKCKVQELYLHSDVDATERKPYSLPQALFSSNCLRVLELDLRHCKYELPSAILASLENLSLNCLCYSGELPVGEWVSTNCPSLKKLSLLYIRELNLENHCVRDLTIILSQCFTRVVVSCVNLQDLAIFLEDREKKDGHLRVSAPNIQFFKWGGNPEGDINLGSFPRLKAATVFWCRDYNYRGAGEGSVYSLFNLVKCVSSATVLRIPLSITEVLFLKDHEPIQFEKLEQLAVRYKPNDLMEYHSSFIADFVRRSPNLSSLIIENNSKRSGSWTPKVQQLIKKKLKASKWESRKFCQRVKHGKIEVFDNDKCMKLVKYFIMSADGLEKMTIFYPISCFDKLAVLFEGIGDSPRPINIVTHLTDEE